MIMTNFLKSRKSIREFKNKKVSMDILDQIKKITNELEQEYETNDINFKLYEFGENISKSFEGIGGYSGVMINSPHYIALNIKNKEEKTVIYSAYYMEKLITKLNELGLDTCWVSILDIDKNKKKAILGDSIDNVDYLLAFGYSKLRNPFVQEAFSERIGVEDLVYNGAIGRTTHIDTLESRGLGDILFYVRFAPSTRNLQPWRFIMNDDNIKLLLVYEEGDKPNLIDAGIVMYYFEALANLQGIKNKWELIDGIKQDGSCIYQYIAEYKL